MPPPTAQEALRAAEIRETHGIHARKTPEGWVVENGKGARLKAAGTHATEHAAILAAEVAIQAGDTRERSRRCQDALDSLQTADYYAFPRDLADGTREWDILRLDGTPTSIVGRASVVQALEDASDAVRKGTL